MSGTCIEKLPHTCGTSDALQVFEEDGKFTGFCFACSAYVAHPYGEGASPDPEDVRTKPSPEQLQEELDFISTLPCVSLPDRKLEKWALDYFGVKIGLSQQDGVSPALHYYPYYKDGQLVAYKTRLIEPKRMWFKGDPSGCDLFGWPQALASGGKRLFVTEGECDAVALYQAVKEQARGGKWEHLEPAVVSLTRGAAGARKDIVEHIGKIGKFTEVVLVFDQDEAGAKATQDVLTIYPTAHTVSLPAKDANACLLEGRAKALASAVLFKSSAVKNTRIINASTLYTAAREQAAYGLSWPWPGLTKLTRGIRFGETYYLGAGVKMGKSELVNSIGAHLIIEHDLKVFMAKPEEANRKTIQMILGKVAGRIFHDPDIPFDYEAYDAAAEKVGDRLTLLSLYQHLGWDSLRVDIISAAQAGAKAVFIDPITNLVNGYSAGETDTILKDVAQELAALALDLGIVVFIFCHLKAPTGESHERGGKVYSSQFAGSRGMMRSCNLMLGLEGNKDPDLSEDQRNIRKLIVLEDREFGAVGTIPLFWDKSTGLFTEMKDAA